MKKTLLAEETCSWPGCDSRRNGRCLLCHTHHRRQKRGDDMDAPITSGRFRTKPDHEVCYGTAHARLGRVRGPAGDYFCVDCAQPADQWSLEPHRASHVMREWRPDQSGAHAWMLYSADVTAYRPRCRRCHALYDLSEDRDRWWLLDRDHLPTAHLDRLPWDERFRHLIDEDEGWTPELEEAWRSFR